MCSIRRAEVTSSLRGSSAVPLAGALPRKPRQGHADDDQKFLRLERATAPNRRGHVLLSRSRLLTS